MISFRPTDEEISFTQVAKNIAKARVRPLARNCEENREVDQSLINELAELGFLSLELPEDWEGLELPMITQVQLEQALSYGDLGIVQGLPGAGDIASLIRLLPESQVLIADKARLTNKGTTAFVDMVNTEEPWNSQLTIHENDDGYYIKGSSQPVRLAANAEYVAVAAKDSQGKSVILWLNDSNDWLVEQGDYRLGLLAAGIGRFSFNRVELPRSRVLAEGKSADELLQKVLTRTRILHAAKEVGLMEAALDYATEYTAERKAFGREIAKFQGVSFRIASMAMETRVAQHLVREAAVKADEQNELAEGLALRALNRAHRSVRYVTDSAVQLLGGHGFVQEFPAEKWMRDAQAQVSLYGREKDLLAHRGAQLIAGEQEVTVP
ncbi:acyl-CoA dehydrogenase family protein [Virgibacillus doumboii]|uniref:acyl-CoA dehydrogenase family protein n=1 Tax=Virgibacillus doumboii TaxID=2697503 RepID=UPI0013E0CE88|nr:acyl-CoA dehydrogenase family protein [Virgibacillus doumboii]